jgi:hypothetical protein
MHLRLAKLNKESYETYGSTPAFSYTMRPYVSTAYFLLNFNKNCERVSSPSRNGVKCAHRPRLGGAT